MPITGTGPILTAAIKADLLSNLASGAVDNDALEILISTIVTRTLAHLIANGLITVTVATTGTAAAQAGGGNGDDLVKDFAVRDMVPASPTCHDVRGSGG